MEKFYQEFLQQKAESLRDISRSLNRAPQSKSGKSDKSDKSDTRNNHNNGNANNKLTKQHAPSKSHTIQLLEPIHAPPILLEMGTIAMDKSITVPQPVQSAPLVQTSAKKASSKKTGKKQAAASVKSPPKITVPVMSDVQPKAVELQFVPQLQQLQQLQQPQQPQQPQQIQQQPLAPKPIQLIQPQQVQQSQPQQLQSQQLQQIQQPQPVKQQQKNQIEKSAPSDSAESKRYTIVLRNGDKYVNTSVVVESVDSITIDRNGDVRTISKHAIHSMLRS